MSIKKIQWSHRNRTPDLPACSAEGRKYFCNQGSKFSRGSKFRLRSSESRRLAVWTVTSKTRGGWPTFYDPVNHKFLLNNTLYKESVSTQRKHALCPLGQPVNAAWLNHMCISALIRNTFIQPMRKIKSFSNSKQAVVDKKCYFLVNIISKSGKINRRKKEVCVCGQ